MFREMRQKIFGLTKEEKRRQYLEKEKQLSRQRELLELEAKEKERKSQLIKRLEDLQKKYDEECESFCEEYIYDLKYCIEKGYWVVDLEEEWYIGEDLRNIPFGFPYTRWSNKYLQSIRLMTEEILETKNQLGVVYNAIIEEKDLIDFEKIYNQAYEKQKQLCMEKYGRDKFSALELGTLYYFKLFNSIMNNDTWIQVFKTIKNYDIEIKAQVQIFNDKISDLDQLIKNPPVLWLSLEEKNNYFSSLEYDKIDTILKAGIDMSYEYDGDDQYYKKIKNYTNAIRLSDRIRIHKRLREQFINYALFQVPVFKEGINWPEITTKKEYLDYDIYENVPKYNDVFDKFPYNIYSKRLGLFEREYYEGHLFIGRLIKRRYSSDINYLSNCNKVSLRTAIDFVKDVKLQHVNEGKGVTAGIEGEELVRVELDKFDDCAINLYNIRLENDGMSIETDCIVIAPNGIFSIEVKNLGSNGQYELLVTKDGQWRKLNKEKNFDEPYNDVFQQTMNHVNGTRRLLKRRIQEKENSLLKDKDIYIQPVVVLANNQVSIDNSSDQVILRPSGVFNYIFNTYSSKMTLSRQEMEEIRDILLKESLEPKKYPVTDYYKIVEAINDVIAAVNNINEVYSKRFDEISETILKGKSECKPVDKSLGLAELYYADLYIDKNCPET